MKVRIPEGKTRLMVVEGKEDQEFFIQLATHMNVIDGWPLHIEQLEGKGNFGEFLRALKRHPDFKQVSKIGIVRDADFSGGAFQSVLSQIDFANNKNEPKLPKPVQPLEIAAGNPSISALMLPSAEREGMLEDLVMDVLKGDAVTKCVDAYFDCLRKNDIAISQERLPKARLRTFITGKNVGFDDNEESRGRDSDRQFLSDVFHMSWWREDFWENEVFDDAKTFLRQLLD